MPVVISLLRGVNLARNKRVKMDALRSLYESLGLQNPQTCVQSGNVVFRTKERDLARLSTKIENAIEQRFGFHADVILRKPADLKATIGQNPFAKRRRLEPSRLVVIFLAEAPGPEVREAILSIKAGPEELRLAVRELYIYFPDGFGRSKLPVLLDKTLKKSGTARNWNTVTKLLEIAEGMESR